MPYPDGYHFIIEANTNWVAEFGTAEQNKAYIGIDPVIQQTKANAQYTALCVNNLHHLAEALNNLLTVYQQVVKNSHTHSEVREAKEALNRIS